MPLPFPGSPGTVGVAAASPPPRCPSACPSAWRGCIRRRGRQRWPWVNAWHLACVRGKGIVSHGTGRVLISSRGEERTVACGDVISPGEERCSWAASRSQLREVGACSWWRSIRTGGCTRCSRRQLSPGRSAVVVALETPPGLPFSVHLGAFCCRR